MPSSMYNNSSSLPVTHELRDEFNRYATKVNHVLMFVQAILSFGGILGNLLALIVINRKSLRHTSSAVFITYLAIFDSAVLLIHAATLVRPRRNLFLHCSLTYLTELTTFNANWILVIITLERCIAVYSPFLAKRLCTVHSARLSMYLLLTVSFLFSSLTFPLIYHQNETMQNQKCSIRPEYKLLIRIYQPILMYGLPDLFLLANLFTVYALFDRHRQLSLINSHDERKSEIRINDLHSSRKQRQLTIMLITVSLSFYLFTTPAMVVYIAQFFPTKHRRLNKMKQDFIFSQISVLLLQLNNATNFIFYSLAGQRFRQATRHALFEYSIRIKLFYNRYILCDKKYRSKPHPRSHPGYTMNTTLTQRSSYSPNCHRYRCRTSTM